MISLPKMILFWQVLCSPCLLWYKWICLKFIGIEIKVCYSKSWFSLELHLLSWWLIQRWKNSSYQQQGFPLKKKSVSRELSWSWSYSSWINNYLWNQCLLPLMLWVRIPLRRGVLDTQHYVIKFVSDLRQVWFSSSTNKTESHDITEILLKKHNHQNPNH